MNWLLSIDEMKEHIGKKSCKEQAEIILATLDITDIAINNMKTKKVKYVKKGKRDKL